MKNLTKNKKLRNLKLSEFDGEKSVLTIRRSIPAISYRLNYGFFNIYLEENPDLKRPSQ